MRTIKSALISALWGVFSFLAVFFIIPLFMSGTPDIMWISLCIALPVICGVTVFRKYSIGPSFVFAGGLVQSVLLVLLSAPVARIWGMNLSSLGVFEYMSLFVYPVAITVLAFIIIKITYKKAE
ncbi:MAG: hypothetical protein II977_08855 [Oscillospiraceae bacterium]|nr:hypothetical protein [Oscillospiraceae bacterium]